MYETWLRCVGFGSYEVSDAGNVRRMTASRGATVGKILKPTLLKDTRYLKLWIPNDEGIWKNIKVHILVATAFLNKPKGVVEVRHLNGIRDDNRLKNLVWGTRRENMQDKKVHGTSYEDIKHWATKIPRSELSYIRLLISQGIKQKDIAEMYGVTPQNISKIAIGERQ